MKKSTLLSLLTTAAIVTTTAGTYAEWDKLEADTTVGITFRQPISVTVDSNELKVSNPVFKQTPSASGNVSFTVNNNSGKLASKLKLTPSISTGSPSNNIDLSNFDISITNSDGSMTGITKSGNTFIDSSLDSTEYTITVTPTNNNYAGQALNVRLDALLE